MTTQIATGLLLLVLPVAYNVLFTVLARTFDYPDILRQPTNDILRRFAEGGSSLVLTWWGFAMTAVLLAPAVVLFSNTVTDANATVVALATTFGVLAAAVQFLGLIRWPLAVPYLARAATDPAADRATEAAVEVTFQTLNRYLGVAVGEHLGYLFTGLWTAFAGIALDPVRCSSTPRSASPGSPSPRSSCSAPPSSSARSNPTVGRSAPRSSRSPTSAGRSGCSPSASAFWSRHSDDLGATVRTWWLHGPPVVVHPRRRRQGAC